MGDMAVWRRNTFRRISQDTKSFEVFANGLMNEINQKVAEVMEKLPEIRAFQLKLNSKESRSAARRHREASC
jgi:hypothetical protein